MMREDKIHTAAMRWACLAGACLMIGMIVRGGYADVPQASSCPLSRQAESVMAYDAYADGPMLHLIGAVRSAEGRLELRHTVSRDGTKTWSAPVTLPMDHGPLHGAHRGNDPQIAANGDRLIAVWSTSGEGFMGSGPMRSALSSDGGRTWQAGPAPAVQDRPLSQGFCDLIMRADGSADLIWLGSHRELRGLHHAHSSDAGARWQPSRIIDAQTCECCWNRLAVGDRGELMALYRDRDPRDLRVASQVNSQSDWKILASPVAFDWRIEACPHAGGGLALESAASSLQVHATVWTAGARGGLYYARSSDAGQSWAGDRRLADVTASHSDLGVFRITGF